MPYKVGEKGSYGCSGYPAVKDDGEVMGCHKTRAEAAAQIFAINQSEGNIGKVDGQMVTEGDFVMAMTTEGMIMGQVEHVMREGGTYGEPGNPYAVESTPENPAVAIRIIEEEDDMYYYTPYSIGARLSDVNMIDRPENLSNEAYQEMDDKGVGIKAPQPWPKKKRKRGGTGGNPAGATVSTGGSMGSKSLFADFGRDYTKTTRLENW
jgi:hypothetical protein